MAAHPSGIGAAAGKAPFATDAITAFDRDGLGDSGGRPPCDERVASAEDVARDLRVEKSGGVRARRGLREAPGRTCIRCRQGFDHLIVGNEIDGAAAERDGKQDVKKARAVHCGEDVRRYSPLLLRAHGSGFEQRHQFARTRDPILILA